MFRLYQKKTAWWDIEGNEEQDYNNRILEMMCKKKQIIKTLKRKKQRGRNK